MADSLFPDPFELWRKAVADMEKTTNAIANDSMKSPDLVRSMQQAASFTLGMQQAFGKMMEAYWRQANLPSRAELAEVAESLQRLEDKVDRLLPPEPVNRPPRTRRPKSAAPPGAAATAQAPARAAPRPTAAAKRSAATKRPSAGATAAKAAGSKAAPPATRATKSGD